MWILYLHHVSVRTSHVLSAQQPYIASGQCIGQFNSNLTGRKDLKQMLISSMLTLKRCPVSSCSQQINVKTILEINKMTVILETVFFKLGLQKQLYPHLPFCLFSSSRIPSSFPLIPTAPVETLFCFICLDLCYLINSSYDE